MHFFWGRLEAKLANSVVAEREDAAAVVDANGVVVAGCNLGDMGTFKALDFVGWMATHFCGRKSRAHETWDTQLAFGREGGRGGRGEEAPRTGEE